MSNLYEEVGGVFKVYGGANITSTIAEAIQRAADTLNHVAFEFNGVTVTVAPTSDPALILRDWTRALSGYIDKRVGPHPALTLADAERAHDAEVEASNEARRAASQAAYDLKAKAKEAATMARLAQVGPIELADADGWQKCKDANRDGYGGACVTYAEQWARLMQLEMAGGKALEDIADATSSEADTEGITGFMYGCAVSMLSKCWVHGETLRRWHNLKTQLRDEGERANESGGVLNPALLNIG